MPEFTWSGKTRAGETRKGEMEAATPDAVKQRLGAQGLLDVKVRKKPKEIHLKMPGSSGVQAQDLMIFTRQFSTMIDAGLPLVQCLDVLYNQQENIWFKKVLGEVKGDVESGKTFADALGKHPKVFDPLFVNLVAAGEVGGILDTIMARLAMQIEKSVKLRKQIKGAMFYPAAVVGAGVLVSAVLLLFVVPTFEKMFADFGQTLPVPTQIVIDLSAFLQSWWWAILLGAVSAGLLFRAIRQNPKGRETLDRLFINMPVMGEVVRKSAVARFTRTMGTMLTSGVPIMDALEIVAKASGNVVVANGIRMARDKVAEGRNLSEPLAELDVFPSMVVQMIAIGESTGALDTMLTKVADFYEEEVDAAVAGLTSLLEPIIMVFLAIVVGGFLIAMYMPIFTIASAVM